MKASCGALLPSMPIVLLSYQLTTARHERQFFEHWKRTEEPNMKYVVLQGDGMADWPVPELGHKTPLEYARTPNMDRIAALGTLG